MLADNLSVYTLDRANENFDIFAEYKGIKELNDFLVWYNKEHKANYTAHIDEFGVTIYDEMYAIEVAHISKIFLNNGKKTEILEAFNTDDKTLKTLHQFKGFYDSDIVIEATNWTDFDKFSIDELAMIVKRIKNHFEHFLTLIHKYCDNKKVA